MVSSACAPMAAAMPSAICCIRRWASDRQGSSSVRKVPLSLTSRGMTLVEPPVEAICPKVSTLGIVGSARRLTSCCRAVMICAVMAMGSIVSCGMAPCPPRPCTRRYTSSVEAMKIPGLKPTCPQANGGCTCCPMMAAGAGACRAPSRIIRLAPPGVFSSAG